MDQRVTISFLVLALCCLAYPVAQAAICTVSGDPHYTMFDGPLHDFQGQGPFVYVDNGLVKIQATHQPCNPPHAVTCIRTVSTQISRPAGRSLESVTFTWGIFYNPTVDPLTVNGVVVSASQCNRGCNAPIDSTDPIARFTFSGSSLSITTPNKVNVTQGRFYLQVALPASDEYLGLTTGLCGLFDGEASNDFTYPNGTLAFASTAGGRFNGPNTNRWGAAFVAGTSEFPALATHHHRYDEHTKEIYTVPALQAVVIPNDNQQATLDVVNFANADQVTEVQAKCLALYPQAGVDSPSVKNCVYDAVTVPNFFVLAASNQVAQANADAQKGGSSDDSGLSRDQIIGLSVGLGLCGLIAVVVAGVLYYRLRKVSAAYQNALVVRSESNQQGGMRMSTNL